MNTYRIEDYGAIADGTTDCTGAFQTMLGAAKNAKGAKTLLFDSGKYLISDTLQISGIHDLAIRGKGHSTVLLQQNPKGGGIWADHCNQLEISGFSYDMIHLPYCEGIVESTGDYYVEISVHDEFRDQFEQDWFRNRTQNFASVVRQTGKTHYHMQEVVWHKEFERLSENRWRVHLLPDGGLERCGITRGDGMYFLSRGGGKDVVFNICDCKDLLLENCVAFAGSSLTTGLRRNENLIIKNIQSREKNGRMISTNADGIHASDNRGTFEISGCYFEGMADDGINVFSRNSDIKEVLSDTSLLMFPDFPGRIGDHLQMIDLHTTHRVKGESSILEINPAPDAVMVTLDKPVSNMVAGRSVLKADDGIDMKVSGDQVYIQEACGRLHIHDCYFGRHRGREILLHTNFLIEDNLFDNNSAVSIYVSMDTSWPEGPVPANGVIRNNRFLSGTSVPGQPVISVDWIADDGCLKDIEITGNTFAGEILSDVIRIEHCNGMKILDNNFAKDSDPAHWLVGSQSCSNITTDIC
jgi:hypothetical protein